MSRQRTSCCFEQKVRAAGGWAATLDAGVRIPTVETHLGQAR
jgi:hypothetical protein